MTIKAIYTEMAIPERLQFHLLSVAALAKLIATHWQSKTQLNETSLIQAALFHDIAKVITFTELSESEEKAKTNLISLYGDDEKKATLRICEHYGICEDAIKLINQKSPFSEKVDGITHGDNIELKILAYADSRIAPSGIVTLQQRLADMKTRGYTQLGAMDLLSEIEQFIQEHISSIQLTTIVQKDIDPLTTELLPLEIKQ